MPWVLAMDQGIDRINTRHPCDKVLREGVYRICSRTDRELTPPDLNADLTDSVGGLSEGGGFANRRWHPSSLVFQALHLDLHPGFHDRESGSLEPIAYGLSQIGPRLFAKSIEICLKTFLSFVTIAPITSLGRPDPLYRNVAPTIRWEERVANVLAPFQTRNTIRFGHLTYFC